MKTITMSNLSIAALLVLSGCGGGVDVVSATDTSDPAGPQTTDTAAAANVAQPTVSISGFVHSDDGAALSGVRACLQAGVTIAMDIGECATTGADGSWSIHGVPGNMLVTVGFSKQGFVSALRPVQTEAEDIVIPEEEGRLSPESSPPTFAGAPFGKTTGGIEFFIGSDNGSEVRASVEVFSYDDGAHDAVYMGADGSPVQGATTGSSGAVTNLHPGLYLLTFSAKGASCTTRGGLYGYPDDVYQVPGSTSLVVPVIEGHITTPVGVDCTGPAAPVGAAL